MTFMEEMRALVEEAAKAPKTCDFCAKPFGHGATSRKTGARICRHCCEEAIRKMGLGPPPT